MVGHSNGGDISMYFAKMYPDEIKKVVTLDNLRVPFITDGKFKILSFRSKDPVFKTDPGVMPDDDDLREIGHQGGADRLPAYRHERSRPRQRQDHDRGHARPVPRGRQLAQAGLTNMPKITEPGPVALYAPVKN